MMIMNKKKQMVKGKDYQIKLLKEKLFIAEQALSDIVSWNNKFEEIWGSASERANSALEHNATLDGF